MKTYIQSLFAFSPATFMTNLFLMIASGLLEGIGLLLLIPLLSLAGYTVISSDQLGYIGRWIHRYPWHVTLPELLLVYVLIIAILAKLQSTQQSMSGAFREAFIRSWRNRLYCSLSYANWMFTLRHKKAVMENLLTTEVQRIGAVTHLFLRMLSTLVLLAVYLTLSLYLSWPMTLIAFVAGLSLVACLLIQNKKAKHTGYHACNHRQAMFSTMSEHFSGMKIAKSHGNDQRHASAFCELSRKVEKVQTGFFRIQAKTSMLFKIGSAIVFSVIFYCATVWFKMPMATLLLLLVVFARILPKISTLQQTYQQMLNMLPAFSAVLGMYEKSQEAKEPGVAVVDQKGTCGEASLDPVVKPRDDSVKLRDGSTRIMSSRGLTTGSRRPHIFTDDDYSQRCALKSALQLKQVNFAYDQKTALKNINLTIRANQTLAIVGHSGAGKSTLADILIGLFVPDAGEMCVDGEAVVGEHLQAWRQSIGYVTQETFLFHDTVLANLRWAKPDASEAEIQAVLKMAAADQFVQGLPEGLNTVIGDRGVRLSGGERQRLALARALLREPALLVLDEATNALDTVSEARIQEALIALRGKMTIVIIAHRLSTVRHADNIIVMERGCIVESGSWRTLEAGGAGQFQMLLQGAQV
jgi:ABC-type multidrug transport system fused ATPase/permease subunit